MPVWLTLVTLVASVVLTGFGTYWIAPKLNAKFENDKIRSAYILDNLKTFNSDTSELLAFVGEFNRKLMDGKASKSGELADAEKLITKLQWKVVEYDIIFDDPPSKAAVRKYQKSLDELRRALSAAKRPDDVGVVLQKSKDFSVDSYAVLKLLSVRANLDLDIKPILWDR